MRHLNKEATAIFNEIMRLVGKKAYHKIDNAPGVYMPLSIDRTGSHTVALAHNGEQNGDIMADPDMTFFVDENGDIYPLTLQNDYMGTYTDTVTEWNGNRPHTINGPAQADLATFANTWMRNIAEQQSLNRTTLHPESTAPRPSTLAALAAAIEQGGDIPAPAPALPPVETAASAPAKKPTKKAVTAPEKVESAPVAATPAKPELKPAAAAAKKIIRKRPLIAANIASRKRGTSGAETAPIKPAPVSLPDIATPAPDWQQPLIVVAPAWMAHAYQMHA